MPGFWVAAGFCAHGLAGAGGIGKVMAEWIVEGQPEWDLWHMDIRRFGRQYRSQSFTLRATIEVYSTYYDIKYPGEERLAGRPLRVSPAYARHTRGRRQLRREVGLGARQLVRREHPRRATTTLRPRGWAGKHWSPAIEAECIAAGERAVLIDQSSFAKLDVHGPGACEFLDRMCANAVDRALGSVIYTQLLNVRGGIEADVTLVRLATGPLPVRHGHRLRLAQPGLAAQAPARRRLRLRRRHHLGAHAATASGGRARATSCSR